MGLKNVNRQWVSIIFLILSSHSVFKTLLAGNELNQKISLCYFDYFILFEGQALHQYIYFYVYHWNRNL